MEIKIKIEGVKEISNKLNDLARRQLPFALAKALTQTAKAMQADEQKEVKKVFDRPTPFIQKGFYVEPATKANLQAAVGIKDQAVKILSPHILGGERGLKRFEFHLRNARILPGDKFVVPGEFSPLDRYGNIPGSQITKILSALKAHPDPYAWRTKRSIRRRKGRIVKYAIISEGKKAPAGVYKVEGKKIKPILIFIKKPLYKKRFYFFEIGIMTAQRRFNPIFHEAITNAIKSAR